MAYAKKWIPPVIPLRNDLATWKALFFDVHQNILDAGLVVTATAGQLDAGTVSAPFPSVSALPANNAYAGFVEYAFDDELQAEAPVVIELQYGVGDEGLGNAAAVRSLTPKINVTIKFNGHALTSFGCPQTYVAQGALTSSSTSRGHSCFSVSYERGFCGLIYGAGSRNNPFASDVGSYVGATLAILMQRTCDEFGAPSADGLMLYRHNLTKQLHVPGLWANSKLPASMSCFMDKSGNYYESDKLSPWLGLPEASVVEGKLQLQQVFANTPELAPFVWIATLVAPAKVAAIAEMLEFEAEVFNGYSSLFITIGCKTGYAIDAEHGQNAFLAMLFEDDQ